MRFEFNTTPNWEDVRLSSHYLSKSTGFSNRLVPIAIRLSILGIFAFVTVGLFRHWPDRYLAGPAILIAVLIVLGKLRGIHLSMIKAGWIKAGPRAHFSVDENAVTVSTRGKSRAIEYSRFHGLIRAESHFFLRLKSGGGFSIPRRAFSTLTGFQEAADWLDTRINVFKPVAAEPRQPSNQNAKSNAAFDRKVLARSESRGLICFAVGMLGGMLIGEIVAMSVRKGDDISPMIPMVGGYFLTVWGCCLMAEGRGFRRIHGLVGGVPLFGLLYIATRARPEPGEVIDRKSWKGFLSAPFAKQSDLSRWS